LFPHDKEFQEKVLETYSRNVILVFEGAQEGSFGVSYSQIFQLEDQALKDSVWMSHLLQDINSIVHVSDEGFTIESPNNKVRIVKCTYTKLGKEHTLMLVLFFW
jgi:hypothetical protein